MQTLIPWSLSTVSSGDGSIPSCRLCRLLAGRPAELSGGGSDGPGVHDLFLQLRAGLEETWRTHQQRRWARGMQLWRLIRRPQTHTHLCAVVFPGQDICNSYSYGIRAVIQCLPAWFRFVQCLRRYRDTKRAFPHLVNAGKYSTSFFVVTFAALYSTHKGKFKCPTCRSQDKALLEYTEQAGFIRDTT